MNKHKSNIDNDLKEKIDNGISRYVNLRGINYYLDIVGNDNGRRTIKKYFNFR